MGYGLGQFGADWIEGKIRLRDHQNDDSPTAMMP